MFVDGIVSLSASGFLPTGANGIYPANLEATATVSGSIDSGGNFSATLTATNIDAGLNGGLTLNATLSGKVAGRGVIAGSISGSLSLEGTIDGSANLYLGASGSLSGMAGLAFSGGLSAQLQVNGGFLGSSVALTVTGSGAFGTISGNLTGTTANNVVPTVDAPAYPTVSNIPGTPKVLAAPQTQAQIPTPVTSALTPAVLAKINVNTSYPGWGIYDANGNALVIPDKFQSIRVSYNSKVVSNPIEKGNFATWNKIQESTTIGIVAVLNQTLEKRKAFEAALVGAQKSLTLYNIVIPEATYSNFNLERAEPGKQGPDQAYSSMIDCFFREIREFSSTYGDMQNAKAVSAAPASGSGVLVTVPAPAQAQSATPTG